ncbi:MAG: hypothetical protein VB118_12420 [Oscillospiraceae bacterium]|nr:hypothetical protein [Oscillospiraceae bacterium]
MMICPGCKKEVPENQYCPECGYKLSAEKPESETAKSSSETGNTDSQSKPNNQDYNTAQNKGASYAPVYGSYSSSGGQGAGQQFNYNQGYYTNTGYNQYGQPYYVQPPQVISVSSYLLMILVGMIPIAGLIIYLIWAFDSSTEINKKNFARAHLIIILISIGISILLYTLIAASFIGLLASLGSR